MALVMVVSEKDPRTQYEVNTDTGTCTCPYYVHRLGPDNEANGTALRCKHFPLALALVHLQQSPTN